MPELLDLLLVFAYASVSLNFFAGVLVLANDGADRAVQ